MSGMRRPVRCQRDSPVRCASWNATATYSPQDQGTPRGPKIDSIPRFQAPHWPSALPVDNKSRREADACSRICSFDGVLSLSAYLTLQIQTQTKIFLEYRDY